MITGDMGFIGLHLRARLETYGHKVIGIDHKRDQDVSDIKIRTLIDCDYVVHLAAFADVRNSLKEPDLYWHNNVTLTTDLQRKCEKAQVPLIYASSSCVHQWHLSPYGTSKKINEETARPGQIGLRFTTVFGDGCREGMLFDRIKNNTLETITNHTRDFIHVDDVVTAIVVAIRHRNRQGDLKPVYEVGRGIGVYLPDLINKELGMNIPVVDGLPCEAEDNTCDPIAMQELGWIANKNFIDYVRQ